MRRPHVYERSAPRIGREAYKAADTSAVTARLIAAQIGNLIDRAERAGLLDLAAGLEAVRVGAERMAEASYMPDPEPPPSAETSNG